MLNPITGNLDYMCMSLEVMSHVKTLIRGLHVAFMQKGLDSPDIIYVRSHKDEMIKQLELYRDKIYNGHELIESINSCINNSDIRKEYFNEDVTDETLITLRSSILRSINSTIDAFNASIKLLDELDLTNEKNKLLIERITI